MNQLILIVENDTDLCHLLELHIRSKGYKTISVHSIKETESLLLDKQPSMVLLDNNLDDGIGMDHIEKLKATSPEMSVVLMTADYIQDLRKSRHYPEIDGLLLKPFSPDKLNEVLNRIPA
jgi:DNA-binding response OmpR family regulator